MTPEQQALRNMSEAELKALVLKVAHAQGWIVFHLAMSPQSRPSAGTAGYPDLTCARDGEVIWLELKREKADLDPAQVQWALALGRSMHVIRPSDVDGGRLAELLG